MYGKIGAVVLASVGLVLGGCTMEQRVVAHRTETSKVWLGDMGVTGHQNKITVEKGSHVTKMSIIGDGNQIFVEDGCTLSKIEIFGENNLVSIPERLIIRDSTFGKGNVIERRPHVIQHERPTKTRMMSIPEDEQPMSPQNNSDTASPQPEMPTDGTSAATPSGESDGE